jgi:DNA-binding GntR family transcriptional regulator
MGQPLRAALTRTLPLQIAERIGAEIVEERYPAGERLKEVELAALFEVSRATIREALRILEKRGLVHIEPQRGAHVSELSPKELQDLFEMRAALLGLAARRLAELVTADALAEVRVGLKALAESVDSAAAYARASASMVMSIARLSGNEQLVNYIHEFGQRFGRYARLGLASTERRQQSLGNWRRLVRAVAARDAALAEQIQRNLSLTNSVAGLAEIERRQSAAKPRSESVHPRLAVRART